MFVPCPHCGFLVAMIVSRPDAAQRCPRCGQPLQLADVAGEAGEATVATDTDSVAEDRGPSTGAGAGASVDVEPPDPGGDRTADAPAAAVATPAAAPSVRAHGPGRGARAQRRPSAPSFTRRSISILQRAPRWPGVVAVAALSLALVLQLLLAQRHALAADARWRPVVATLCQLAGCDVRPWREPEAFTMLARDVRPAGSAGVLQVEASFRNDAQWPQAWPRLLLRLNDRHGRTVGERLFTPDEYLGRRVSTPETLAPGQSASVRFAVREPAADLVAFDFDFR